MSNFANVRRCECVQKTVPDGVVLGVNRTLILQSVINSIKGHGRSRMSEEVCGTLVGSLCWDDEAYLRIDGLIAGHQTGSASFDSSELEHIHDVMAKRYADKMVVGWYHTHPGFGIFLSNMDFFTHENFFAAKWQLAYVYDPQSEQDGFFFWNGDNMEAGTVSVLPDVPPIAVDPAATGKDMNRAAGCGECERGNDRRRMLLLICGMILAAMFAAALVAFRKDRAGLESGRRGIAGQQVLPCGQENSALDLRSVAERIDRIEAEIRCLRNEEKAEGGEYGRK